MREMAANMGATLSTLISVPSKSRYQAYLRTWSPRIGATWAMKSGSDTMK